MEQLGLFHVPVKGFTIDPDARGLLDGPGNTVCLPTHKGEIVHIDLMS